MPIGDLLTVDPERFYRAVAPVALVIVSREPKLSPEVLLAQAAIETGWSPLGCCQDRNGWRGVNNFSGISPGDTIADYASWEEYVDAYVETIHNGLYNDVLAATDADAQAAALGASPWSGGQYRSTPTAEPGSALLAIMQRDKALIAQRLAATRAGLAAASGVQSGLRAADKLMLEQTVHNLNTLLHLY